MVRLTGQNLVLTIVAGSAAAGTTLVVTVTVIHFVDCCY
jgi:hypothetical protein